MSTSVKEAWASVIGFEGFYEVSDLGNVRSCTRQVTNSRNPKFTKTVNGKVLAITYAATRKYAQVGLSMKGKTTKAYVHRLVAEAFLTDWDDTVNHIDGDKTNNRLENLEWVSYSDNNKHAFAIGLKLPSGG